MTQLDLIQQFDGLAYDPALDRERLTNQHERIKSLMLDGKWRTLCEIAIASQSPESSVSAQLRHLRKPRFGGYTVNRRRREGGLFEYQVVSQ